MWLVAVVVLMNWMAEGSNWRKEAQPDRFGWKSEKVQKKDLLLLIEHLLSSIICLMMLYFIFPYKFNIRTVYYTTINSASVIFKATVQSMRIAMLCFGSVLQHI